MVTMKEIAELAGVSHGTVSNVLAKKGNVSVKKIRLVEDAAKQLGYSKNSQAQNLRKESLKHVSIIIPNIEQKIYNDFYSTLFEFLSNSGYTSNLYFSKSLLEKEKECIQFALSNRSKYTVLISCHKNPTELYDCIKSTKLIYVNQPQSKENNNELLVTIDFAQISKDIFNEISSFGYKQIAFWGNLKQNPTDIELCKLLKEEFSKTGIVLTEIDSNQNFIQNNAINLIKSSNNFDIIICADSIRAEMIKNMAQIIDKPCPTLYTIESQKTVNNFCEKKYIIDYRNIASQVYKTIISCENNQTVSQVVIKSNYKIDTNKFPKFTSNLGNQISLITLASPTAEAISNLAPDFKNSTGINLNVIQLPYYELFKEFSFPNSSQHDMLRMDILWLRRFQEKLLYPLSELPDDFKSIQSNFHPAIAKSYSRETQNEYSLPLDPSVQMLFYRKDLFEDIEFKRAYYEKYKTHLSIPKTFEDYDQVAQFFTKKYNQNSPVSFGITMTYGSVSVAVNDFMPRVRDYLHRDCFSEKGFNFNTIEFKNALESYIKSKDYTNNIENYWWADSIETFAEGDSATTIAFVNHASRILNNQNSSIVGKIGTAIVPNRSPLLGGGCVGVSKNSRNVKECAAFINWVYSDKIANLITLLGGLTPCYSAYKNEEILSLYPWLRDISSHFDNSSRLYKESAINHFDDYIFEHIIGVEVRNAVLGISSVSDSLEKISFICNKEFNILR